MQCSVNQSTCAGRRVFAIVVLIAAAVGCIDPAGAPEPLADVDEAMFAAEVYPILLRDCAMSECHGASERFLRIVGPGRVRLSEDTGPLEPATASEIRLSLTRVRSMLEQGDPAKSLLLQKPLELLAGGASHEGHDRYGRNVYQSRRDPSYVAIERWARDRSER